MFSDILDYLEAILGSTDVKGFPIVSSDGQRTLVGFIDRTELRYVLGMLLLLRMLLIA